MHKVSNKSMNNIEVCSKLAIKTPKQNFCCYLWADFTLVLEDQNNDRLCKFVWIKLISTKMYYVLFTKILQGGDTTSATALQKKVLRICT